MSHSPSEVLRAADHRRMPWLNGGGLTTEIVAWPFHDSWDWRVSVADVEHSGPFSVFPGVDRTIALLQGNRFVLKVGAHEPHTIAKPFEPFVFRGDESTLCTLTDGPVQDLNLMVRRAASPMRLSFVSVDSVSELVDVKLAIVVSGEMRIGQQTLSRLDAIRSMTPAAPIVVEPVGVDTTIVAIVAIVS